MEWGWLVKADYHYAKIDDVTFSVSCNKNTIKAAVVKAMRGNVRIRIILFLATDLNR